MRQEGAQGTARARGLRWHGLAPARSSRKLLSHATDTQSARSEPPGRPPAAPALGPIPGAPLRNPLFLETRSRAEGRAPGQGRRRKRSRVPLEGQERLARNAAETRAGPPQSSQLVPSPGRGLAPPPAGTYSSGTNTNRCATSPGRNGVGSPCAQASWPAR